jgi:aryl-alcohol dehydrogenase
MTSVVGANAREIKAALVRKKGDPFELGTLHLEPPRVDEVLVRIVATGICQTDAHVRDQEYQTPLAKAIWMKL